MYTQYMLLVLYRLFLIYTLVNKRSNHFPMETRDNCYVSFLDKSASMQPFGLPC